METTVDLAATREVPEGDLQGRTYRPRCIHTEVVMANLLSVLQTAASKHTLSSATPLANLSSPLPRSSLTCLHPTGVRTQHHRPLTVAAQQPPPPPRQPPAAAGDAIPTADEAVFLLRINRELQVCLIPTALNKWHFNTSVTAS